LKEVVLYTKIHSGFIYCSNKKRAVSRCGTGSSKGWGRRNCRLISERWSPGSSLSSKRIGLQSRRGAERRSIGRTKCVGLDEAPKVPGANGFEDDFIETEADGGALPKGLETL